MQSGYDSPCIGECIEILYDYQSTGYCYNTNPIAEFLVEQGKRASLRYHSHIVPKPEDIIDAQEGFQSGISPVEVLHTEEEPDLIDTASSEKEQELTNPFADVSEYDDDFSFLQR